MVGGEVGVKCCGVEGWCVGVRSSVRSCRSMVQTAARENTNTVTAAARPWSEGEDPPCWSWPVRRFFRTLVTVYLL